MNASRCLSSLVSDPGTPLIGRQGRRAPALPGRAFPPCRPSGDSYWQVENLNEAIRVFQLNAPVFFRYSLVYQNVQSSTGSMLIEL